MDTMEALLTRRSIRKYRPEPVPVEDLKEILAAGATAPSAVNMQHWYFVAVQDPAALEEVKAIMGGVVEKFQPVLEERFSRHPEQIGITNRFLSTLGGAPVCLLVFMLKPDYPDRDGAMQSVSAAIENVLQGRLGYKSAVAGMLGLFSEDEKRRAFEILDQVGLADFAYARTDQLSGGQKQRVGIARALVQDPLLMLADEPIASLDPKSSRTVMEHLRWAADELGVACLANLHQVDFAMEFSDRIVALKKGRVVFDGAPHLLDEAAIADIYGTNEEAEAGSDFGERSVRQVGELSGSRTREADPERLGKAEAKDSSSPEVAA